MDAELHAEILSVPFVHHSLPLARWTIARYSRAMSHDKRELLRPILAEWAKGNVWVGAELMAPDITFSAAPPANFVSHGLEETARQVLDLLAHWSDYRIEAEELEELGEDNVLAIGRQRGTGKLSGAEVDYPIFIVWKFRENELVGVYFEGTRDAALQVAG
jgi:ketosteroid isomerase-like protein